MHDLCLTDIYFLYVTMQRALFSTVEHMLVSHLHASETDMCSKPHNTFLFYYLCYLACQEHVLNLPVAVMPNPGLSVQLGPEVGLPVVVYLWGEAQQAAEGVGWRGAGRGGQTVLLIGTLKHEHGPVLQVCGLLHHLRVEHQVRGG